MWRGRRWQESWGHWFPDALNINLASQPYEAAREYRRRMTASLPPCARLAVVLVGYIVYQRIHSRDINRQLADVRAADRQPRPRGGAGAGDILNKPANRDVADQSEFLNELFARKALSWTRIFTGMEQIVPPGFARRVHEAGVQQDQRSGSACRGGDRFPRPRCGTGAAHGEVHHFRQPQVVAENVVANTSESSAAGPGNIQFDIAAVYVPSAPDDDAARRRKGRARRHCMPQKAAAPGRSAAPGQARQGNSLHGQPGVPRSTRHRISPSAGAAGGGTDGQHSRDSQETDARGDWAGGARSGLRRISRVAGGTLAPGTATRLLQITRSVDRKAAGGRFPPAAWTRS